MTVKVVSWNIELGQDLARASDELRTLPGLANADVLLAQELSPSQAVELADRLGWDHHYFAPACHPKTQRLFGNAVFSRWPLAALGAAELAHTALIQGQPRGVTGAVVTIGARRMAAFSTHIETPLLSLRRRVAQVENLADEVDAMAERDLPAVVGGDFNSASRRSQRAFAQVLRAADLQLATDPSLPTLRRFGRAFRLDHIFGRHLEIVAAGVTETATSDHEPVWANFEFGDRDV